MTNHLTPSSLTSHFFSRICLILLVGWLCCINLVVNAEPWKCGTPLLCEHPLPVQNLNTANSNSIFAAPAAPAKLGQVDRFFIHIPETSVKATCVAVGAHCYIFIENTFQSMLTEAEAAAIAEKFDTEIYPEVHHWIGSEFKPGLDRDNKITILFHDVGNNESGQDYGGYFSPVDQHPTYPTSNRRDILYMDIFQFKERAQHTFYSSLAHELAHLINWYQNGGTTDQRWLEEGIASFTEWGIYGTVHTLFVDGYLTDPSMSLTTANNFETYYGAAFMFLLYLYENHGGIDFIRKLAAEDTLGLLAIDSALSNEKYLIDVFLNWGIANWLNNPTRGRLFSYQNLRNRKITAHTPRITRYPTTSDDIPIDSWGVEYILFQNLPENLELTLRANTQAPLYANIAYFSPNSNIPIVKPIPSVLNSNAADTRHTNKIEIGKLSRSGQILLIVTSEYSQTFQYVAKLGSSDTVVDINALTNTSDREINHSLHQWFPNSVTFPPDSSSQPINVGSSAGTSLIASNLSPKLEPMTQIHLSSNYNAIVIQENNAFATSDWGLEIFTLNPLPTPIGEIATPGTAHAIAVDGDYVYIADGTSGVHLIEVNPLTSPRIVKTLGGFQDARDVHIANGNLYTLDTVRGLLVFNQQEVLNGQNPHPRRTFKTAGTPYKVLTNDEGTIYLSDDAHGLYILTSDPLGGFTVSSNVPLLALDFEIIGKYALIASGNLRTLNIGNPVLPELISQVNTPGQVSGVMFYEGLLYLTDQQAGLHIVNVSSPNSQRLISSHPTIGNAEDVALWRSVTDAETYAYIADGKGGIQTFDVTNSDKPIWVNHYDANGFVYALDVSNEGDKTTIAIANGIGGLRVAELTDPYNGKITKNIRIASGDRGALSVNVRKQHAFVGTEKGMDVVNLETGDILTHITTTDPVWAIALIHDYAYLCANSIYVVDITSPEQSRIVSHRNLPGSAYNIAFNTSHAYVASLEGGVHILDISEPAFPRPISHFATEGAATNVVLDKEHLYVLDNRMGVLQLDAQDPNQLKVLAEYSDTRLPIDASVNGNYLYLLDNESLQIIDTRTMSRRVRYKQLHAPFDLVVNNSALYIADQYQLRIFRVHTDRLKLAVEEQPQDNLHQIPLISSPKNQLLQNFPNPFNPETWIPYSVAKGTDVSLSIYDTHGHLVLRQQLGFQESGKHTAFWNGRNGMGESVASGVYFYTLTAGNFSTTRKMVVQR